MQLTVLRWKRQDNGDTIALFAASNNNGEYMTESEEEI